jgi:hypothetical protein
VFAIERSPELHLFVGVQMMKRDISCSVLFSPQKIRSLDLVLWLIFRLQLV